MKVPSINICRLCLIFALGSILCACNSSRFEAAFLEGSQIRLQVGQVDQFVYNPQVCQLAYSFTNCTFCAHNDSMSDYFLIRFDRTPDALGQRVSADIEWTTRDNIQKKNNVTLEVGKIEGDKVWLWSQSARIGLTVRILE